MANLKAMDLTKLLPVALVAGIALTMAACSPQSADPVVPEGELEALERDLDMDRDELVAYLALDDDVERLAAAARKRYPDRFAGIWRDPERGARIFLAFTGDAQQTARTLAEELSDPGNVVGVDATFSMKELRRLADSIDIEEIRARGAQPVTIGVDVTTNRVSITLTEAPDDLRNYLNETYGSDRILIETGPMLRFNAAGV